MDAAQLLDRYIDVWNETDPAARRVAVADLWAEDASYVDPLVSVSGHEGIAAFMEAVHERAPGHTFRLLEGADAHHNVVRFGWELVPPEGGEPLAIGFDVAETEDGGRIARVIGFLDKAPAQG